MKPLTFKDWLKTCYAIDYDRWAPEMTPETIKIWREGYEWYLKEWEGGKCDKCGK